MNYYIITGTSRGIGEALAKSIIEPGNTLFAVSRTMNEDLVEYASSLNVPIYYHEADLSKREEAELFISSFFEKINLTVNDKIALINNAGMLEPVAPVKSIDFKMTEKHLNLNLLAPFILSSVFLARTAALAIPKVILNISSGASLPSFQRVERLLQFKSRSGYAYQSCRSRTKRGATSCYHIRFSSGNH
jgi:benzil reductase ((S)-benzoin forming)